MWALVEVQSGAPGSRAHLISFHDAPVQPDGTFVIDRFPPGDVQIVALCQGWTSRLVLAPCPPATKMQPSEADRHQRMAQVFHHANSEDEVTLAMEPTASLTVTLHSPLGLPVSDAKVVVGTGVDWRSGGSEWPLGGNSFPSALTDANGVARIDNLPIGQHSIGIVHPGLHLPLDQGSRIRWLHVVAGEHARQGFALEPKRE